MTPDTTYAHTYLGRRATDVLTQVDGPWRGADIPSALAESPRARADPARTVDGARAAARCASHPRVDAAVAAVVPAQV